MRGKAHLTCGVLSGLAVTSIIVLNNNFSPAVCTIPIAAAINSLLPDIDLPQSTAGKKAKIVSKAINKLFGHRTFTHSGLWLIVWIGLLFYFRNSSLLFYPILGFLTGYLSHILSDTFTHGGVPWAWPFSRKRYHFTNVKSGEKDYIFTCITVILIIFLFGIAYKWIAPV